MKHGLITREASAQAAKPQFNLRRGTLFWHAKWLGEDRGPLLCEVTAVRLGAVYWKQPGERKAKQYFPVEDADKYVKGLADEQSPKPK